MFDSELSGLHAVDNSHFTEFRNEVKIRNAGCEWVRHLSLKWFLWPLLLICHDGLPGILGIFTPLEKAVKIHFHPRHGTKTTPVFLTLDGEAC